MSSRFLTCYQNHPILLTEGAVGLRTTSEFGMTPDQNIAYASLLYSTDGRAVLETIYRQYLQIACEYHLPILLLTNTRRVNQETVATSSYQDKAIIQDYTHFLRKLIADYSCEAYIGGMIGCKGDAYTGKGALSKQDAFDFHTWQVEQFAKADVDFVFGAIMPAVDEIIGMSHAIERTELPYIISFMIREDGHLIDGHKIDEAIGLIDRETKTNPLCYLTNCVHPKVLITALKHNHADTVKRLVGIQANAAHRKPEELDNAAEIQTSDPASLAAEMLFLHQTHGMKIFGGCCGTDDRHIREIAHQLTGR